MKVRLNRLYIVGLSLLFAALALVIVSRSGDDESLQAKEDPAPLNENIASPSAQDKPAPNSSLGVGKRLKIANQVLRQRGKSVLRNLFWKSRTCSPTTTFPTSRQLANWLKLFSIPIGLNPKGLRPWSMQRIWASLICFHFPSIRTCHCRLLRAICMVFMGTIKPKSRFQAP